MPMSLAIDRDCDFEQNLVMGQEYYIHNKEYPQGVAPGVSCRWTARSQPGTKIVLTCEDVDLPSLFSYYGGGKFVCALTTIWDDDGGSTTPAPNICDCGWKQGVRIVGGEETGVNEFPSMAGILDATSSSAGVYCGGTIISNRYESPQQGYDIGILRTESIIQFSLYVGPVCLPFRYSSFNFNGQEVTMLGWGALEFSGPKSDVLEKVNVLVTPNDECSYALSERSKNCQKDKLLISLSGNPALEDAKHYCGKSTFKVLSHSNSLTTGLISPSDSHGGKFLCTMTAVSDNGGSKDCDCGWKQGERIVGGKETGVNEFPMMVGIVDVNARHVYCGGTIISNRYILTAASCIWKRKVANLIVVVGEHDESQRGYDIGILKTKSSIQFSLHVGPACLPFRYKDFDFRGQEVTMLGWGTLEFGGQQSDVLQKANVNVTSNKECSASYHKVIPEEICTYSRGKDACQMDSGGPLLWMDKVKARLYLVGIIASGKGCASNVPSVNTRVTSYLSWIASRTSGKLQWGCSNQVYNYTGYDQ
nr:unnamed protein product [Callosobruchus analis]